MDLLGISDENIINLDEGLVKAIALTLLNNGQNSLVRGSGGLEKPSLVLKMDIIMFVTFL